MPKLWVQRIEVHEPSATPTQHHGQQSYALPAGKGSLSVTFCLVDDDGRTLHITEVLAEPPTSFDTAVAAATARLKARLARFGHFAQESDGVQLQEGANGVPVGP